MSESSPNPEPSDPSKVSDKEPNQSRLSPQTSHCAQQNDMLLDPYKTIESSALEWRKTDTGGEARHVRCVVWQEGNVMSYSSCSPPDDAGWFPCTLAESRTLRGDPPNPDQVVDGPAPEPLT